MGTEMCIRDRAKLSVNGLDELIDDLEEIARMPDSVALEMLTAEAEIISKEQKTAFSSAYSKGYSKGITARSVSYSKKLKKTSDGRAIYVYPKGTRNDGNKRRVAEVAFINEYGAAKRGIPKRLTIRAANEKAAMPALQAAARVYDNYLKSKNL